MSRPLRLLAVLAVAVAAAAGGALAAQARSSTSGAVRACETSNGQLALATSAGRCKRGDHGVSINEQGPRGATGRTGPAGRNGVGATSAAMDVSYSGSQGEQHTKTVGTFGGYKITITCEAGQANLDLIGAGAPKDLYVHGSLNDHGDGDSGAAYLAYGDNEIRTEIPAGNAEFSFEANGSGPDDDYSDQSAHLLLLTGTSTATLDFYQYSSPPSSSAGPVSNRCQSDAQLTPSSTPKK